ncbi:hypothetical protein [Kitasatospora phosalacinea]|uniref:hypothetical protein n=1 Tax=Kitasatospora phosalacinea TaxID=2065 RepID=UPI0025528FDB|nr:hypothetical protein [Kitasatospora phosalacinea]
MDTDGFRALEAIGHESPHDAEFDEPVWTPEQRAARLPRLTALFAGANRRPVRSVPARSARG